MPQQTDFSKLKERVAAKKAATQKMPTAASKASRAAISDKIGATSGGMALPWGEILMGALLISGLFGLIGSDFAQNNRKPNP